jgi:alpha-tubulin suppressor-like RCC1 family protein
MISAGNAFTCGVSLDHRGYCWGAVMNSGDPNPPLGKLGSGSFAGSKSPVAVAGDLRFRSIIAGARQACGLTLTGEAYCWGNNTFGELGIGTTGGRFASPQRVSGGLTFASLSLADHTCGVTVNHNLYCWGLAFGGRLGNGQSAPGTVSTPTRVLRPAD